jgi:predicted helicase
MNSLRDNQTEALKAFENHYYEEGNTKGILSMCCGSGKSRTFYEILKKCMFYGDNFFIYTTSRILLVESIIKDLLEWTYREDLDVNILIKVSEVNVKQIILSIKAIMIENNKNFNIDDFEDHFKNRLDKGKIRVLSTVILDIKDTIKNYLNDNKIIIIITTYDSISKIYESVQEMNRHEDDNTKQFMPNLLVADEAHNVVSENNNIKTAKNMLEFDEDSLCNPEKFLFMTATPLKIIKRNRSSSYINDEITYSMDNKERYGKVFYEYTFYEGIRDKYILNFDMIYLNDLDNDNDLDEFMNYDKDEQQYLYFSSVSKILLKVIKKFNLKRILVFMSNQSKVNDMNKFLEDDIKEIDDNIQIYKIISGENKNEQKNNRKNFEIFDDSIKILLSVDMLNEGIDIPICDSVLFAEERNSETVIVQNIGRALRIYTNENKKNKYIKDKAYIIIPTKIYKYGEHNNSFSSKFKKIREVCDIMKEEPSNNPKYYKRITKGNIKTFTNINDASEITNEIKIKKESLFDNIDDDKKKLLDDESSKIVDTFELLLTTNNLSNITYEQFKEEIQKAKIDKLWDIRGFLTEKCLPFEKPHIQFKKEWLCYGDLLFNKIYTYKEATDVIKTIDLTKIESTKDWIDLYNNIINQALDDNNIDNELLNKFIYIPYNPKTYYLEEWNGGIDWTNFLGKELNNITGVQIDKNNPSSTTNASNNLKNLINNDKDKVKNIIASQWQ